jgi:hypothetical protein
MSTKSTKNRFGHLLVRNAGPSHLQKINLRYFQNLCSKSDLIDHVYVCRSKKKVRDKKINLSFLFFKISQEMKSFWQTLVPIFKSNKKNFFRSFPIMAKYSFWIFWKCNLLKQSSSSFHLVPPRNRMKTNQNQDDVSNSLHQGCQMVSFQTKNSNLVKFWRSLDWKLLIYLMATWNISRTFGGILWPLGTFVFIRLIFFRLGIMYREDSVNPGLHAFVISSDNNFNTTCSSIHTPCLFANYRCYWIVDTLI